MRRVDGVSPWGFDEIAAHAACIIGTLIIFQITTRDHLDEATTREEK